MENQLLNKLGSREISKTQLLGMVEKDFGLLSMVLEGTSSPKATIRYGCGKILVDLSEKQPDRLYPYIDSFVKLLDSRHRILTWNAMATIANLAKVDQDHKFDAIFDKYYSYLNDEYLVTVSNVVANSAKIAYAKPYLAQRITAKLLTTQDLKLTPHLTEECKRVIIEQVIKTFNTFFDLIEDKDQVISFAQKHLNSSRPTLRKEAQKFLKNCI